MAIKDYIPGLRNTPPRLSDEERARIQRENEDFRQFRGKRHIERELGKAIELGERFVLIQKDFNYRSDLEFAVACTAAANTVRQVVSLTLPRIEVQRRSGYESLEQHALFTLDPEKV